MTAFPIHSMSRLDEEISTTDDGTFDESKVKRSLHNAFDTPIVVKKRVSRLSENFQQMPVEYMKVFLRLRPFTDKEIKENEDQKCMKVSEDRHILTVLAPKDSKMYKTSSRGIGESVRHFTFTKIFDEATGQKEFFNETASPLVQSFIDGNNALIFTYGVTNAGKTYTIQGTQGNEGIIPRAIDCLFENVGDKLLEDVKFRPKMANNLCFLTEDDKQSQCSIKEEVLSMADDSMTSFGQSLNPIMESSEVTEVANSTVDDSASQSRSQSMENYGEGGIDGPARYAVFASFVEVYKELTYDLLTPLPEDKRNPRPVLAITDDGKGASYVKGMREIQVNSPEEVMKILSVGRKNLHVAATKINKDSSRSHCIFTLTLVQVPNIPDPRGGRVSKISFCDLAGSERANKTREVGDRLKEAGKINQSLMKLGMCIEALRHNQRNKGDKQKQRAVSFRDSKLTRLFRSYLLGEGRACMVVNANMCASVFDETAQVLKFSAIARDIQIINKPKDVEKKKSRVTLFEENFKSSMEAAAKRPRATIAWERKLTPVKDEEEKDEDVEESGEESDESDSEEESFSEYDIDFWKDREKKFRDIIDILKKALSDEKIKSKQKEAELRDELSHHHRNQMVDIETRHEKNIEDTISMMEDEQEKRVAVARELANIDLREMKERFQKKYTTIEKDLEDRSSKLQTVEEKLTESELQNNMLKMELDKMKIDLENKDKENASVQKQLRRSRYSGGLNVDDLLKENEEGRCIIQSLVEESDGYKTDLENAHQEITRLNEELKASGEKIEEILLRSNPKKDEIDHEEHEKLKQAHSEFEKKASNIETQSLDLRSLIGCIDVEDFSEGSILSNTEGLLRNLTDWINTKEQYVLQLTNGIEEEKNEKSSLEVQLSSTKVDLKNLNEKLEAKIQETSLKTDEIKRLNNEKNELEQKLAENVESLQSMDTISKKHDEAKKQISQLQSSLDESQQKLEDASTEQKRQRKFLEDENEKIKQKFKIESAELTNQLKEEKDAQEKLKTQTLKEAEIAATQLDDANAVIKDLRKEVEESKKFEEQLVKETNRLHDEVENLKKENLKVKETSQKRTSDASDLLRDVDILTRDRNDLLARVDTLQRNLDEANAEKLRLEEEYRENVANNTTVHSNTELLELKNTISEKESLVNQLQSKNDELLKNRENLEEKISNLENSVAESEKTAEKEKSDFVKKIEKITEERTEMETKLREKESDAESLETRIQKLEQERENLTDQIGKFKQIDDERESENKDMADKIEHLQKSIDTLNSAKNDLEREKQTLSQKLSTIEENFQKSEAEKQKVVDQAKNKVDNDVTELTKQLGEKQSKFEKLEKELKEYKTTSEDDIQNIKTELESQISAMKKSHEKEVKKLETQSKKAVEAKEKELASFRENRDRIVAALEVQIKNDKSTNEILKENLDDQMSESVRLKSQNAAFSAEIAELNKQLNDNNTQRSLKKSASSSAMVVMDKLTLPVVNVKSEPKSPPQQTTISPRKRTSNVISPAKNSSESDQNAKSSDENVLPTATRRTSSRGGRGRKRGSTIARSRGSTRRTRGSATRPATPYSNEPHDNEEVVSSPKKSRQNTRGSRSASIKEEVNTEIEEQGVLDDSELLRETGHSHNFPKPTMELDVTPQVSKKAAKSRKRANKKEEHNESEEADMGGGSSLFSSTRKTRGNANNSNNSKTSDEENTGMSVAKNLTKVGGMIRNSPVGQALKCIEAKISPAVKSPKKAKIHPDDNEQPKRTRRLVKLQADDISLPLEATPSPDCVRGRQPTHSVSETPARMMRRLRKRK